MTKLAKDRTGTLEEIIPKVTEVFEEACQYIDGHSQPLTTLGVSPTLTGFEQHRVELQALKKKDDTGTWTSNALMEQDPRCADLDVSFVLGGSQRAQSDTRSEDVGGLGDGVCDTRLVRPFAIELSS